MKQRDITASWYTATFWDYCFSSFFFIFMFFNCAQMNIYYNSMCIVHLWRATRFIQIEVDYVLFQAAQNSAMVFVYRIYVISRVYGF